MKIYSLPWTFIVIKFEINYIPEDEINDETKARRGETVRK